MIEKYIRNLFLILVAFMAGCAGQNNSEKHTKHGALIGAASGAVIGQAIGRDTKGTVIGAAAGTILGGLAGNRIGAYMDRQEQELKDAIAASEASSIQRSQDVLTATFKSDVLFDVDSANLRPGASNEIARVASILAKYSDTSIMVQGHTDSTGPDDYNQKLSERRAEAVKIALIHQGVKPERIQAVGYGETHPVSSNKAENRRVEILIKPISNGA